MANGPEPDNKKLYTLTHGDHNLEKKKKKKRLIPLSFLPPKQHTQSPQLYIYYKKNHSALSSSQQTHTQ